jgi:hypothetical protein
MTAGELVAALQMAREVGDARGSVPREARADGISDPPPEENVTSLPTARHTK